MSGKRPPTERGVPVVGRARPARRIEPTLPPISRNRTIDELKSDVGAYTKTVERHDEAIDKWLRPIATELPAQLETLRASIGQLSTTVTAATAAMTVFVEETRRDLSEHAQRIDAVEERSEGHEAKWLLLDAEELPPRVAALEQKRGTDEQKQAVETALVAHQNKIRRFVIKHAGKGVTAGIGAALAAIASHLFG